MFRAHKRAPQLERRTEQREKWLTVFKQRRRIQAARTQVPADFIHAANAISANNLAPASVPDEKVLVISVVAVDIGAAPGALAHGAKRELAQPADFLKHMRQA